MAVKYFCDRCDKEKDYWDIQVLVKGQSFEQGLCQDCIEELLHLLEEFFKMDKLSFHIKKQ